MSTRAAAAVLEARNLSKQFALGGLFSRDRRRVQALTDVSIAVRSGETLAVVGESGCGKSTLARCLMQLVEPSSGSVRLHGEDAGALLGAEPLKFRRAVQIVFQDPYASLNPRRTVAQCLDDPLRIHAAGDAAQRRARAGELLRQVGLGSEYLARYPHELSGGQRQRVAIARALAPGPELIVCDEAVSALDVSIQAQIINLLKDIQSQSGVAYLFITHNLGLVQRIADRIVVMYLGRVVESGEAGAMRERLLHPYSRALFAAAPKVRRAAEAVTIVPPISGEVPSAIDPPAGCAFHPRCPHREPVCEQRLPELETVAGRLVRCHFAARMADQP